MQGRGFPVPLPAAQRTAIVNIVPIRKPAKSSKPAAFDKHVVAAIVYDGLCTFEFGIVVELFGLPRPELERWYDFVVCSADTGPLTAIGSVMVMPAARLSALRRADTIIIPGWRDAEEKPPRELV